MDANTIPYTPIPRDKALVAVGPEPAPKTVYEQPPVASGWLADATRRVRHTARVRPRAEPVRDNEGVR